MSPALLFRDALARLSHLARSEDPEVKRLVRTAALLTLSGLVHVAVWLLAGAPSLEGPVSWRKPIVFGVSSGVMTASLAWLVSWIPSSAIRTRWTWTYLVTMTVEILLIDIQRWRGVGSHFNNATPLDGAIFSIMGTVILVSMFAAWKLGRAFAKEASIAADVRLAGRLGVGFLMLGALMGIVISVQGSVAQMTGGTPAVVGAAGQLKLVHAVALHGIQVLPVLAFVLASLGLTMEERRRRLVRAGVGYGLLFVGVLGQAMLGRAPTDLVPATALVLVVGVSLLLSTLWPAREAAPGASSIHPGVA